MHKLLLLLLALGFKKQAAAQVFCREIDSIATSRKTAFPFGVASGDPRENSVVLWTCLYTRETSPQQVQWELSLDSSFSQLVNKGLETTGPDQGFVVKLQLSKLKPGTTYYYRFGWGGKYSPTGRTRTASTNATELKFGVVSCSSYSWGYFNAYAALAKEKDLQAVIHLGDYIYEQGPGEYTHPKLGLTHLPKHEIVSLQDYRSRYAQYRLDPALQEAHRMHPFIVVWDDHELANDAYKDGAQNHQPEKEGTWEQRTQTARRAYFEWLPIESNEQYSIRRSFDFGQLASLFMLDGRLEGRDKQLKNFNDPALADTNRSMLGRDQANWLIESVSGSKSKWKLIGNQVIFSAYEMPPKFKTYPKSTDMWNGYPAERQRILNGWERNSVRDVLVLTGDVHSAFSFDLRYRRTEAESSFGAEWVTTSVSSSNLNEYTKTWKVRVAERWFTQNGLNPELEYCNLRDHGYLVVSLNEKEARGDWKFIKVHKPGKSKARRGEQRRVKAK